MQLFTIEKTAEIVDQVVRDVCEAVVSTMGPNGKLAFIASGVSTKTTKDGVTVAKSIKFEDPHYELVNRVLTEPAIKTDQECGDGTTTTILLTARLQAAFRQLNTFVQQRELETIVNMVVEELTKLAIKIKVDDPRLYAMALTSSNQDRELARVVSTIYKDSPDRYPEIDLKEGVGFQDQIERTEGRVLNMSYGNPAFGGNGNGGELVLRGFQAITVDARLSGLNGDRLRNTLDHCRRGLDITQPVVLIVRSIEQDVVSQIMSYCDLHMRAARMQNQGLVFQSAPVVVMATNFGGSLGTSQMQDMAVMLQTPMVSDIHDADHVELNFNPSTLRLTAARSYLTDIAEPAEAAIAKHAADLESALANLSLSEQYSLRARFMEKRIRNLRGQLVTIHVGGETNSEIKERIDRYEDVVKAVRSGLENGILPGGGVALQRAAIEAIKRYRNWNLPEGVDWTVAQEDKRPFIDAVVRMALAPREQLFWSMGLLEGEFDEATLHQQLIMDLATGVCDTPEKLGVYDTAYASITALKGGLQTAKLLSNAKTLVLGDKVHAVRTPVN